MSALDEQILRASKEIMVKFIETGRVSPSAFPEMFRAVYQTIDETVKASQPPAAQGAPSFAAPEPPPKKRRPGP
jgi:hypothetical protein